MKIYILLISVVIIILSCGQSIFGPLEQNDQSGTYGDIERHLQRAEEYYIGAEGDQREEKLTYSQTIYNNLLSRSDINDDQEVRAARGYGKVTIGLLISDIPAFFNATKIMYEALETSNYTFSPSSAPDNFLALTGNIRNVIYNDILVKMYDTKMSSRHEEDFINMTFYNLIAMGFDFANFMVNTIGSATSNVALLNNASTRLNTNLDNFNYFTSVGDFSNQTNAHNETVLAMTDLTNTIAQVGPMQNDINTFTTYFVSRNNTLSQQTKTSDNIITFEVGKLMDPVIDSINGMFSAFTEVEQTNSLGNQILDEGIW
jgi:hypothetical protein